MLNTLSAAEYAEWQAYFSIEPFPAQRADRRTAELKQVLIATAGAKRVPSIAELIPDWWDEVNTRQTPEQMQAAMKIITARPKKKR